MFIKSTTNSYSLSGVCLNIFQKAILDYHRYDCYDSSAENPFPYQTLESLLYQKNWIDDVQWHLEDRIRDPGIDPALGLELKRRIDKSNQDRTDIVEEIDNYIAGKVESIEAHTAARYNTESPAWAIDRLSILMLKIFHMNIEFLRTEDLKLRRGCEFKLKILIEQKLILCEAIDRLIFDIESGDVKMKVYRQMKMYNDSSLNPFLHGS